jgi:hypothetical protein
LIEKNYRVLLSEKEFKISFMQYTIIAAFNNKTCDVSKNGYFRLPAIKEQMNVTGGCPALIAVN